MSCNMTRLATCNGVEGRESWINFRLDLERSPKIKVFSVLYSARSKYAGTHTMKDSPLSGCTQVVPASMQVPTRWRTGSTARRSVCDVSSTRPGTDNIYYAIKVNSEARMHRYLVEWRTATTWCCPDELGWGTQGQTARKSDIKVILYYSNYCSVM